MRNRRAARYRTSYSEARARDFYSKLIHEGDLCFDIGANVGDRTKIFVTLGARVVAVEPQPDCVAELRGRFASNEVEVMPEGVASRPGKARLVINRTHPGLSTMSDRWRTDRFPDEEWGEAIHVPVTTLDNLIKRFGTPTFCKIDVEGYEGEVLSGLSSPLPMLSFEFTGIFLDEVEANLAHLAGLGPIDVNCVFYEQMRFELRGWTDPPTLLDHLARSAKRDDVLSGDVYVRVV